MHCFACDKLLDMPPLDRPTGRYYCEACMEPTTEVMLAQMAGESSPYQYELFTRERSVSWEELEEKELDEESEDELE